MKKSKMFGSVGLLMAILFTLILVPSLEVAAKTKVLRVIIRLDSVTIGK